MSQLFSTAAIQGQTLMADVVVIGSGASGLTVALTAACGGNNVVLFEKMPHAGGTSNFAEGIFAVESVMQRGKNIEIKRDEAFKKIMEHNHWRANPRLVRTFVDKSASTIDWLQQLGVEFIEPAAIYPGGPQTWHLIKGRGAALIRVLLTKAKENGVKIYFETSAKKVLVDENRVIGLITQDKNGNSIWVQAKAVIIATGGFANNKDMLEKYTASGRNIIPVGNVNKMGDGIQMAWEIGAASEGTSVLQLYRPGISGEPMDSHLNAAARQPYLWINQDGDRFCDETIIFQWPYVGNVLGNQKNQIMYAIFDENTKKYMMEKGIDIGVGVIVPVTTRLVNLDSEIQRGINKNEVFAANILGELAVKINVNPKVFLATMDEYNQICDSRYDYLFAKEAKYLQPVKTPKFYAIRCYPHFLGTLGGIKINHKTEVLNKKGEVIPGIYAIGNDAGGMYGDSYDLWSTGGALGFAINSGRIAGENVLRYIGK